MQFYAKVEGGPPPAPVWGCYRGSMPGNARRSRISPAPRSAVTTRDGQPVELSGLELKLLRYFVDHRAVLPRDELLDKVWGYDATPVTRTVDVHVASPWRFERLTEP